MAGLISAAGSVLDGIQKARDWVGTPDSQLSPLERMGKAGVRSYCRAVQGLPAGGYSFGIGAGIATGYICEPVWNEPGNSPDTGYPRPPFTGGQCQGVQYEGRITGPTVARRQSDNVQVTLSNGSQSWIGLGAGPVTGGQYVLVGTFWQLPLGANATFGVGAGNATFKRPTFSGLEVRRVGGGADTCGDPPPAYQPPAIPAPYNFGDPIPTGPGLPPVSVPDPTGRDTPGIDIDFGDGSGISLNFGDGASSPGGESPPDRPEDGGVSEGGSAASSGNGEYDFGEPPEGSEWVGYRWSFDYDPILYGGVVGTGPEWVSPRVLGNAALRMETTVGSQGAFLSDSERVDRAAGAQFRPVGGLRVVGCKFVVLPTLAPVIIPLAAPLPPPEVVEN